MSFYEVTSGSLRYMASTLIDAPHAFTTRYGGVSEGEYSSLNLSVTRCDKRENIQKNYDILCDGLNYPRDSFAYTRQVHSTVVRAVTEKDKVGLFEETEEDRDGLVTDRPNLPIIAYTADCTPILLYDPVRKAAGAVHAGWRGTVGDIAGNAVRLMVSEYGCRAENIRCAIGPCISRCCFETDADVPDAVIKALGSDGKHYIAPKDGKFFVVLKGVNASLLMRCGVKEENIDISDECTMCLHDKYWSHRFTKGRRGSQACAIMLRG